MKIKYNTYANAAGKRKGDEMTIFDMKTGKYKNVKVWTESRRIKKKLNLL